MSDVDYLNPKMPPPKEESTEAESALHIEHSIQVIKNKGGKDKAIWAVISDFDVYEAMKTLSLVVSAFHKLGRNQLADDLWARAKQEDFGAPPNGA